MLERITTVSRQAPLPLSINKAAARRIGRLAIRGLYREAALAPKPGLVTPSSQGSHGDMDFTTFVRSLQSLRAYFPAIAACGQHGPDFAPLQALGIAAESAMLAATGASTPIAARFSILACSVRPLAS